MLNLPETVAKAVAAMATKVPQNTNPALRELILNIMAKPPKESFNPAMNKEDFLQLCSILKSKTVPGSAKLGYPMEGAKEICSQYAADPTYGSLEWLEKQGKQPRHHMSKKEAMWVSGLVRNADEKFFLFQVGKTENYPVEVDALLNIEEASPEISMANQRHYLPFWWTLRGLTPCFMITPPPGMNDSSILTSKMLICLGAIMSYFDLESWGFTLRYLDHDVVSTNGINYRGSWVFADMLSPHWEDVKSALLTPHTFLNLLPHEDLNCVLGRPAHAPGQGCRISLIDKWSQDCLALKTGGYTHPMPALTINCGPGNPAEHKKLFSFMERLQKSGSTMCNSLHLDISSHEPLAAGMENARMTALARLATTHYSRSQHLWTGFEEAKARLRKHAKNHPNDDFEISGYLWPVKEKLGDVEKELIAARTALKALLAVPRLKQRADLKWQVENMWRASEKSARVVGKTMKALQMKCEL